MDEISIPLEKQWLSVADIAVYMGVSPHVVTSILRAGELPAVKFGREWRVARADLQKYLNQARQRLA